MVNTDSATGPLGRAFFRSAPTELAIVWVTAALAFVAWAWWQGRDFGFDALNHHLYLGAAVDGARIHRDFMAAGLQSYQAPYAYWPLVAMARAGWSSGAVLAGLALMQSTIVPALWWVARGIFPNRSGGDRTRRAASVMLGLCSPVVLGQIGSTFADLAVAVPVVLACGLALHASRSGPVVWRAAAGSGASAGVATALKLTSAPFAIAIAVPLLFAGTTVRGRLLAMVAAGAACLAAFVALYAPWGWVLWQTRGNPLFPFLNGVFRSPDFPPQGVAHVRYLPADWVEALARPIAMMDPQAHVYYEIIAPDARPFALVVACSIAGWRLARGHPRPDGFRRAVPLLAYLVTTWCLWLSTTGNGRYFIPALVLLGPALVAVAGTGMLPRLIVALGILALPLQLAHAVWMQPSFRWDPRTANGLREPFLKVDLPSRFAGRPLTFVTASRQSYSFLSLGAHPEASWIKIGGWPMTPEGPGAETVLERLRLSREIVVVAPAMYRAGSLPAELMEVPPDRLDALRVYGIEATGACEVERRTAVALVPPPTEGLPAQMDHLAGFWYCPARFSEAVRSAALVEIARNPQRQRAERAFDRLEEACPRVLRPARQYTEPRGSSGFVRWYPATDARLYVYGRERIAFWIYGARDPVEIGSVEEVLAGAPAALDSCGRLPSRYVLPWRRD